MSFVDRPWIYVLSISTALAVVFRGGSAELEAAPIVFGFEATISEIQGDATPLNLPFSLGVGEPVKGKLSFTSEQDVFELFSKSYLGNGQRISFKIDETEFGGRFNQESRCCYPFTDLSDRSEIELWYKSETDVYPGWPGSVAGHYWDQLFRLTGSPRTITAAEQLLDFRSWNQLTLLRELNLQIGHPEFSPSTVFVRATVGDFFVVPEPSTASLISALVAVALMFLLFTRFPGAKAGAVVLIDI